MHLRRLGVVRKRAAPSFGRDELVYAEPSVKRRKTGNQNNVTDTISSSVPVEKGPSKVPRSNARNNRVGRRRKSTSVAMVVHTTPSPMREMSIDVWVMINPLLTHREIGNLKCTGDVKIRAAISRFTEITHLLKGRHPKTDNHLYPIMTLVGVENPRAPCFPFLRKLVMSQPFRCVQCRGCGGAVCCAHCRFPRNASFPVLEEFHVDDNIIRDWAADGFNFGDNASTPMFPALKTMVVLLHKGSSFATGGWQTWADIFFRLQLPRSLEHFEMKTNPFEPNSRAICFLWEQSVPLVRPYLDGRWHETCDTCSWNLFSLMPRGLKTLLMPRFDVPLRALSNLPPRIEKLRLGWIDGTHRSNTCVCSLHHEEQVYSIPATLRVVKYAPNQYRAGLASEQTVLETLQALTEKIGCKLVQEKRSAQQTC